MKYAVTPQLGKILTERGLTQNTLSEMSGVPQGSISRFDKNSRHESAHLVAISRALGLTIEDLFIVVEEN
ncbi:transcriptional regulator [Paenibacillus sp. BIHB 4019]|uniref:Transcriptional regulator n=1 Tax=Paenibacillus sp. BIHB 4019 TaxID=1870819 RepID=A0A1B2DJ06_9BACL|nr:helix-turn-helix transcriptional regulator [Paenibacillus sp. BIHB 4019]ANY67720.1 transcriptional regulator [Paenibacillus sp. BIHB 4019]